MNIKIVTRLDEKGIARLIYVPLAGAQAQFFIGPEGEDIALLEHGNDVFAANTRMHTPQRWETVVRLRATYSTVPLFDLCDPDIIVMVTRDGKRAIFDNDGNQMEQGAVNPVLSYTAAPSVSSSNKPPMSPAELSALVKEAAASPRLKVNVS